MKSFQILCLFVLIKLCASMVDRFDEELLIHPLPSGHIYVYFQFTTRWESYFRQAQHVHLFPRALAEILSRFEVKELHISMTQGLWRHDTWGYPVVGAPPGAEVWAWFEDDVDNVDLNWKRLTDTLSGLLCATFNFIDASNSVVPEFSFRPDGVVPNSGVNASHVRYATLPREIVCTENLTPWLKLLPCDSKRGFASLLNAAQIHNTRYHSLGLVVRPICADRFCHRTALESRQTVSLVYDPALLQSKRDWSFRYLFGQGLVSTCSLATRSVIYVDVTYNSTNIFKLSPPPIRFIKSTRGGFDRTFAEYDMAKSKTTAVFSISAKTLSTPVMLPNSPPPLHASRYLVGYGQEKGGITTRIHNNQYTALDIILFEQIPWFVEVYLHTLRIDAGGRRITPKVVRYIPGRARQRPYYLEIAVRIPARAITTVSIEFNYVFLKWQEYPPDANHGFYIGSAAITCMLPLARNYTSIPSEITLFSESFNASRSGYLVRIYTEILLVTLPTPDFSMPYNVVCLACTVIALAFGPLHNITTKRLQRKNNDEIRKAIVVTVLDKIKGMFRT